MKGLVVDGVVRALRRWARDQPADDPWEGLLPADKDLLNGPAIMPNGWYPYEQHMRLMEFVLRHLLNGHSGALRDFCAQGTRYAYTGPHKRLIKPGRPADTMRGIKYLWGACHDFAELAPEVESDRARIAITKLGPVGPLEGEINAGWISGILQQANAKDVRAEVVSWDPEGSMVLEFRWRRME